MTDLLSTHQAANTLRTVAVWLDSGDIVTPDDPPRQWRGEAYGWQLLVEQWPDGEVTIKHRDPSGFGGGWSAPAPLSQVPVTGVSA